MNLSTIKQKELKGKKNVVPKLRTILANPYNKLSPVLPQNELLQFRNILKTAISDSGHTLKTFATQKHIHLGLESSLRAINGRRFSCVFVSLSLRPSHVVRLIASSAAAKIPTAPVYAQPKLEELTHELFGIRALVLVLPLAVDDISPELAKWVNAHKTAAVPQKIASTAPAKTKKPVPKAKPKKEEPFVPPTATPEAQKQWSGDYISCSNDCEVLPLDLLDAQTEVQLLGAALSPLVGKAQTSAENTKKLQAIEAPPAPERMEVVGESVVNDNEFLPLAMGKKYQTLTVHQIRSNPEKKPKNKRNKNKMRQALPSNGN